MMSHQGKSSVLIISDRWGSKFQGGISAAVRILSHQFHSLGLLTLCTVLQKTDEEDQEAKNSSVKLICPYPRGSLCNKKPESSWLLSYESFFPHLTEETRNNVKVVLGFGLATSEAANFINKKEYPNAKYYIANLWPPEEIRKIPRIIGSSCQDILKHIETLHEDIDQANTLISMDEKTKDFCCAEYATKHYHVTPKPIEKYFDLNEPQNPTENYPEYRILSFLEEHDSVGMASHKMLAKAVNLLAEGLEGSDNKVPKWKILGVPEGKEKFVRKKLKPSKNLDILAVSHPSDRHIEEELQSCHLVLIPESPGMNSLNLALSVMAIGVPLLVKEHSPCHYLIERLLSHDERQTVMVVNMENPQALAARIRRIFSNYQRSLNTASQIRLYLKTLANGSGEIFENSDFLSKVKEDTLVEQIAHVGASKATVQGNTSPRASQQPMLEERAVPVPPKRRRVDEQEGKNGTPTGTDQLYSNIGGTQTGGPSREENPGEMRLHVNISGIPEKNCTMAEVELAYTTLQEVQIDTPHELENLRPGISVSDVSANSVIYTMQCDDLATLEFLWHQYETLKLNKLITSITITEKTLKKVGALYLALQTTLDIEEYDKRKIALLSKEMQTSRLLLLDINPTQVKENMEMNARMIFGSDQCTHVKQQEGYIIKLKVYLTEKNQHILTCRKEILAILGVRRYLLLDTDDVNLSDTELESKIILNGTHVLSPRITQPVSLQEKSLLPYKELSLQTEIDRLRQRLDITIKESSKFKIKLSEMSREAEGNINQLKILENQLQQERQEKSVIENQFRDQNLRQASKEKGAADTEIKILQLKRELDKALKEKSEIEKELAEKSKFLGQKEGEYTDIQDIKNSLEEQLSVVEQEKSLLENQLSDYRYTLYDVKTTLLKVLVEHSDTKLQEQLEEIVKLAEDTMVGKEGEKGKWSKKIRLEGPKQGPLFDNPSGLAFHGDKLLVCDRDNNVVRILNQDYICERTLGTFQGLFPKPFQPQSIAISKSNLCFILDDNNLQIVVCDENDKIVKMIELPKNSKPGCIALAKGFIFITDVKRYRILKYTEKGQYVAEVGGERDGPENFSWPGFLAVNSKDVIMVSDWSQHCIKCFDMDLNFLYQYGEYGVGDGQLKYTCSIAIDGDDNVYVSDFGNGRIVKWQSDGKWVCNLFKKEWIVPWYVAVSTNGDCIAVRGLYGSDIRVFYE